MWQIFRSPVNIRSQCIRFPALHLRSTLHSTLFRAYFHPSYRNLKCNSNETKPSCHKSSPSSSPPPPSPSTLQFWSSPSTWKRSSVNTFRCLVGCTTGDFSAMWYLQSFHPDLGTNIIMSTSMISGIATSLLLETVLLRTGRDQLPWGLAAKTAAGMSMISMVTMEIAENAVDFHLTGGVVQFDSVAFWGAALVSVAAGFLAPLPYNYVRLRRYGKACH